MNLAFRTKPFQHQATALGLMYDQPAYGLFMEMGTGKSKTIVDEVANLYLDGKIDTVFITAPKSVFLGWADQFNEHSAVRDIHILRWDNQRKNQTGYKRKVAAWMNDHKRLRVFLCNTDAWKSADFLKIARVMLKNTRCYSCVDESTNIKSKDSKRTKAIIRENTPAIYRRILSGYVTPESPIDIFSQFLFLDERILGANYFNFRARYAILEKQYLGRHSFDKVVGYQRVDELQGIIGKHSFRVRKDECLDLPEKVFIKREIELTKEQKKYYDTIRDEAFAILNEAGDMVTAPIVLTQIAKLQQIILGYLIDDDKQVHEIPGTNPRLEDLVETLQNLGDEKAIIWCPWTKPLLDVYHRLQSEFGEPGVKLLRGGMTGEAQKAAVDAIQNGDARFICINQSAGSHGITLTRASYAFYYGNHASLELRLQSEDRIHRIGQTTTPVYIDYFVPDTVEERIFDLLRNKKQLGDQLMGDNWKEWI